ncbi:response regulator [Neorhizobium sp. LjRoot104]
MEEILSGAGFAVVVASSGQEAIDLVEGDVTLSAVVTDVRLGAGPSGWDVAHRARELTPTMPVIYMTGDSANLWAAHGVPGSTLLQKPFVEAQLITAIATLLNQASTTGTTS